MGCEEGRTLPLPPSPHRRGRSPPSLVTLCQNGREGGGRSLTASIGQQRRLSDPPPPPPFSSFRLVPRSTSLSSFEKREGDEEEGEEAAEKKGGEGKEGEITQFVGIGPFRFS